MSWLYQPLTPAAAEIQSTPPSTAGYIKVWMGSDWQLKPCKIWDGGQWVIKPLKFWDGSQWVLA